VKINRKNCLASTQIGKPQKCRTRNKSEFEEPNLQIQRRGVELLNVVGATAGAIRAEFTGNHGAGGIDRRFR